MDYVFINSDVYFQTDIDFSKIPFENTTIVVPQFVIDEIQNAQNKKLASDFDRYKKLPYFIFDNSGEFASNDIVEYMKQYNYPYNKKFLVTFNTDLLVNNLYYNLLDYCEFNKKEEILSSIYSKFIEKLQNTISDAKSEYYLAICYDKGIGLKQSSEKSFEHILNSANKNFSLAQLHLAVFYEQKQEIDKALIWSQKAVKSEYVESLVNMGDYYYFGKKIGVEKEMAFDLYMKAANKGHWIAQNNIGVCYKNGDGVNQNYNYAIEWFKKSAQQGYQVAQFNLGLCYLNGEGVEQNFITAAKWFKKASDQNNAEAQKNLGILYFHGEGVPQSNKKAFELILTAAKNGLVDAQSILGQYYYRGIGTDRNPDEAIKWYSKAANQGDLNAQYNLGQLYYDDKKYKDAIIWELKAAEQGYNKAQHLLALCYLAENDINKSVEWFKIAANNNNSDSCCELGKMYENRQIVDTDKNPVGKAIYWFQRAVELGNEDARQHLSAINRNKYIEDAFKELNTDRIETEHDRAKHWYSVCLVACIFFLLCAFEIIRYNITNEPKPTEIMSIVFRVLATCTSISLLFISINQAARMRKSMLLLSKEIQEYEYIKGLLKAKNILSTDSLETNKEISTTISKMIEIHLEIQKERIGKEDHTEVKDITPELLNFFKDNTSTVLSNYNEMYKTMSNTLKEHNMNK